MAAIRKFKIFWTQSRIMKIKVLHLSPHVKSSSKTVESKVCMDIWIAQFITKYCYSRFDVFTVQCCMKREPRISIFCCCFCCCCHLEELFKGNRFSFYWKFCRIGLFCKVISQCASCDVGRSRFNLLKDLILYLPFIGLPVANLNPFKIKIIFDRWWNYSLYIRTEHYSKCCLSP